MITTTRRDRSRSRHVVALLVAGALAFTACSNSGDDDDAETPTADETASEATATEEATAEETATEDTASEESATEDTASEESATDESSEASTEETVPEETGPDLGEFQPIEGVPGVTDEAISVGIISTGPSNPLGYCLLDCYVGGVQAYFDYRNELGGVHGRQLEIAEVADDEVGAGQVKMLELIENPSVFAIFAAPLLFQGFPEANEAGIPVYSTPPASPNANGLDNVYLPSGTFCTGCPRKQDVQAAVVAGATKVASLGFGESQSSKECVGVKEQTFQKWGPDVGIEFAYKNDTLSFGFPNGVAPEVTAMKDAGVDFIITCIDVSSVLILEQELERQGMTDVKVALPQGYGDDAFFADNADLLEGNIVATAFTPFEANIEGTLAQDFLDYMDAGGYEITDNAVYGWLMADMLVTGLLAAGPQFDRASVISASNAITDWTAQGMVPPVDWSRQHTAPTVDDPVTNGPVQDCMAFLTVEGGTLVLAGEADAPFFCFDPTEPSFTEPTSMSFF